MNIAIVIDSLDAGGSESVVQRLAGGLGRRGHHAHVYCLKHVDADVARLQAEGVVVRQAVGRARDPRLAFKLLRWLDRDAIDVVHAHSCAAAAWTFPLARLTNRGFLHVRHGWQAGAPSVYARLTNRLAPWFDQVATNCFTGLRQLPPAVRRRARVLPNGVDVPAVAPAVARRDLERLCGQPLPGPVILAIANVRYEKDYPTLLRAMNRVRRHWPDVRCVCVGLVVDEACWREVRHLRRKLNLERVVRFPGPCPEASRLLPAADAFCLASRREAMPNVILEAMAAGAPLVATTVGDVGTLSGHADPTRYLLHQRHSALLVPPGQPEDLAEALCETLGDPAAAQRRAAAAADVHRARFTTAAMVGRYEAAYAAAVARRRPRVCRAPRTPRVLMLGPAPPVAGGMVTSIGVLLDSPLKKSYRLLRRATPTGPTNGRSGVFARFARNVAGIARHLRGLGGLARILVRQRVDLLHIHTCSGFTFYRNLVDLAVARLLGRCVILHVRGGAFVRFYRSSRRLGQWVIRRGLAAADGVVAVSRSAADALHAIVPDCRLFVVPNAYMPEVRAPGPRRERRSATCRFLFLGPLTAVKGLGDLLRAMQLLQAEGLNCALTIAGPAAASQREHWERLVRQHELDGHVTLWPEVAASRKADVFFQVDCLVHPSHLEALPNTILEAAAAGLPVVATDVGACRDVVACPAGTGKCGPLVPAQDPVALAGAMREIAEDHEYAADVAAAQHARVVTSFSPAALARRMSAVYRAVLDGLPPAANAGELTETTGAGMPLALENATPARPSAPDAAPLLLETS